MSETRIHADKLDGQTIHCEQAILLHVPSVPKGGWERFALGWQIGAGLLCGVSFMASVLILVSKAIKALLA